MTLSTLYKIECDDKVKNLWEENKHQDVKIFIGASRDALIVAHGSSGRKYKKSNGLVSNPEKLIYWVKKLEEENIDVRICTCHPTSVGKFYPEIRKNLIGYGIVDGIMYVNYSDTYIFKIQAQL